MVVISCIMYIYNSQFRKAWGVSGNNKIINVSATKKKLTQTCQNNTTAK